MVEIDPNVATQADLEEWYRLDAELKRIKTCELLLRTKIYKTFFVTKNEDGADVFPKEGVNKYPLDKGFVLKADRTINRTVDDAAYAMLKKEQEDFRSRVVDKGETLSEEEQKRWLALQRVNLGDMVKYKPELALKNYRVLTEEERAVFDEVLTIKDGTPQMEIVLPKRT